MAEGRLGYGASGYPVSASDLQASALQILADDFVVDLAGEFSQSPTMVALKKSTAYADVIRWDVTIGGGGAADAPASTPALDPNFPASDGNSYVQDKRIAAELTIGRNKTYNLVQVNQAESVAAKNRGKAAVKNLFALRVKAAIREIGKVLNSKIFTGSTASNGNIVGFETIFSSQSYAGIQHTLTDYTAKVANVDYYPDWRPLSGTFDRSDATLLLNDGHGTGASLVAPTMEQVNLYGATTSNVSHALDAFDLQMRMKGRSFNIIITSPRQAEEYRQVYKSELVYNINNGEIGRAELGVTTATYKGRPIVEDAKVPANTWYFLDLTVMELLTLAVDTAIPMDNIETLANPGQLNLAVGALARDTIYVNRFEIGCLPQLAVYDTRGLSRLKLQA